MAPSALDQLQPSFYTVSVDNLDFRVAYARRLYQNDGVGFNRLFPTTQMRHSSCTVRLSPTTISSCLTITWSGAGRPTFSRLELCTVANNGGAS